MKQKVRYIIAAWTLLLCITACPAEPGPGPGNTDPDNPIEYWSITWNLNGGRQGFPYPTQIVKGEVLVKPSPDPTKTGNTFGGWYSNSGLTETYNFANPVTANLALYAKWNTVSQPTEYWSITWNMNGGVKGTGTYPAQVVKGAVLAKPSPDPTKTGSTFGGWYTNSGLTQTYNFANPVTTNLNLYAKWNTVPLESVTGLANKLAWLQSNAQSNGNYTIEVNDDESIGPHTLSYSGKSNITVTLRSAYSLTRTVSLSSNGVMFRVSSGVTLIIDDNIILQGRSANSTNSLVRVEGGTFTMRSGQIRGNTVSAFGTVRGGGVYVQEGTFRMEGGQIRRNTVSNDSSVNSPCSGGGVYVGSNGTFIMSDGQIFENTASGSLNYTCGGGVYVEGNGTFTMSGGTIGGSLSNGNTAIFGGGVYVGSNGTFTMSGGQISYNWTDKGGGGVYVEGGINNAGTFTMSGTAKISNNSAVSGGGVYNTGTFTMNNGEISINSLGYNTGHGGGVYNGGTFTMNNGKISLNSVTSYSTNDGGGVYNAAGTFTMAGGEISNNGGARYGGGVYSTGTFTMTGGEISLNSAVTAGGGVFASGTGTFRIVTGTVYGANPVELSNSSSDGEALYSNTGAAAQRGTLSGTTWTSKGNLSTTDNTIEVLNGDLVP